MSVSQKYRAKAEKKKLDSKLSYVHWREKWPFFASILYSCLSARKVMDYLETSSSNSFFFVAIKVFFLHIEKFCKDYIFYYCCLIDSYFISFFFSKLRVSFRASQFLSSAIFNTTFCFCFQLSFFFTFLFCCVLFCHNYSSCPGSSCFQRHFFFILIYVLHIFLFLNL